MFSLFIFLSFLALLASLLCLALLYDSRRDDDSRLMKLGVKLIVNAGLLLVSLRYAVEVLNQKTLAEETCDKLLDSDRFDELAQFGCSIEEIYSIDWFAFLTTSAAEGASWIVPFIFASVGVNALSQGLIGASRDSALVDSFIDKRSENTQKILRYFLSKFL